MTARRTPARGLTAMAALAVAALIACTPAITADPDGATRITIAGEAWSVLLGDAEGMRGRADFAGTDGMLFDQGHEVDPDHVVWVMDGVAFPLDIAWFDGDGRLVGTTTMATCAAPPCPTYRAPAAYRWAVEAPVGAFDELAPTAQLEVSP